MKRLVLGLGVAAAMALSPVARRWYAGCRASGDWYDEPLPDQPASLDRQDDDLTRSLVRGRITRSEYRRQIECVAALESQSRPLTVPADWCG